jgi:anti-anti-sigma factor
MYFFEKKRVIKGSNPPLEKSICTQSDEDLYYQTYYRYVKRFSQRTYKMMKISVTNENSVLVLGLAGKFNIEEVTKFEETAPIETLKTLKAVAIDFSEVEYIDSSALGSLIKMMNKAKNIGVEFNLYNMPMPILSIFKLAYLDKFFLITTDADLKTKYPKVKF